MLLLGTIASPAPACDDVFAVQKAAMVTAIEAHAAEVGNIDGQAGVSPQVFAAILAVPRHLFVPQYLRDLAYADVSLPIGSGQTISQPYIVALMTDLLRLPPDAIVLEVGTGSGDQAAVLASLAAHVYSIETIPTLATEASDRLGRLGYANVTVRSGDGYAGWPDAAPFDGILATAGAQLIPPPLIEQLKAGGRMVIPVGEAPAVQRLMLVEKRFDATVTERPLLPVRFVPFTHR